MRPLSMLSSVALTAALVLTGCSSSFDPIATPTPSSLGGIHGIVHGGQQPVVGAQVYLLAANTTGYGGNGIAASTSNASLSLLTSASNTAMDTVATDPTYGDYYVTTASDGSFSLGGDYSCTSGQAVYLYAVGGNPGSGSNSAAGFLAILGTCPATGNFATATPFVWVNEVSTVAAAYAMAGFATDALHVSSSGTTLAKTGISNAFANAAQLETLGSGVALATTPGGNSAVPQTELNTLADILAACVNTTGPGSSNCSTLFSNTESGGTSGTKPTDTASAAINLAHNPAPSTASVSNLFGLQAAVGAPFLPALSATPNDFTVAIAFTGGSLSTPRGIAIDASGNAWVGNATSVTKFTNLGVGTNYAPTGSLLEQAYSLAIDASGNVWVANQGSYAITELTSSGALAAGSPFNPSGGDLDEPYGIAIDASGNAWVTSYGASVITKLTSSGALAAGSPFNPSGGELGEPLGIAVDASSNVWVTNYYSGYVTKLTSSGALAAGSPFKPSGANLNGPLGIAIDASGNAWVTDLPTNSVAEISSSGGLVGNYTGAGMNEPSSVAIDGSGNVWISSYASGLISELSASGSAISPSSGYTASGLGSGGELPTAIAVDGSGDVWVSCKKNNSVYEFLGAGSPVVTPLVANLKSPYGTAAVNKP